MAAIGFAIAALVLLLFSVLDRGLPAFTQTFIKADIYLDPAVLDPSGNRDPEEISKVLTFAYAPIIKGSMQSLADKLQAGSAPGHHADASRRDGLRGRERATCATT